MRSSTATGARSTASGSSPPSKALAADGCEDVFDVTVADVHAFDANGLVVHNCGEQPLPSYGCCDLGSVDLTSFVQDPFAPGARFDFAGFAATVAVGIRMLDNVLDVTAWPLPQQKKEAMDKRRVGLGFTGLGDALIELNLRYDSAEGRAMAARIAEEMRDAAYLASVEIAKEKGPFPQAGRGAVPRRAPLRVAPARRHQVGHPRARHPQQPHAVDRADGNHLARVRRQRVERHRARVQLVSTGAGSACPTTR